MRLLWQLHHKSGFNKSLGMCDVFILKLSALCEVWNREKQKVGIKTYTYH